MEMILPTKTIPITDALRRPCFAYGWFRANGDCLFIGKSVDALDLHEHRIIGRKAVIQADDTINVWETTPEQLDELAETLMEQYLPRLAPKQKSTWTASGFIPCGNCGKAFLPTRKWSKWCSTACRDEGFKARKDVVAVPLSASGEVIRNCLHCKAEYTMPVGDKTKNNNFCPTCRPMVAD